MQKAFIAITLALTLTCAFAGYSATNWVKTPVNFLADNETNFTTTTTLTLGGLTTSDVNVISYNGSVAPSDNNLTNSKWNIFTKTITAKDLSSSANNTYNFSAPQMAGIFYGYVVGYALGNDSNNVPQYFLYQTKINGATALPRVTLTSNTVANFTPSFVGATVCAWKTWVYFYGAANQKVNYSSITLGGSTIGKEFTFSSTWNGSNATDTMSLAWGEALSNSQVFAAYTEAGTYKVAVVDFGSGTLIGAGNVAGQWQKSLNCTPYVTDKKYYGLLCTNASGAGANATLNLLVSSNTTTDVVPMGSTMNATQFLSMQQYAGYLAIFYKNPTNTTATVLSYEIWDTSALTAFKNRTDVLTYDPNTSGFEYYVVPQGGMFGLLYNYNATARTSIQVGQVMGASYLTTVFGALMTIVAGLFLF